MVRNCLHNFSGTSDYVIKNVLNKNSSKIPKTLFSIKNQGHIDFFKWHRVFLTSQDWCF